MKAVENKLNKHANFWVEKTNAGEATRQKKRIKGNLKTKDNQIMTKTIRKLKMKKLVLMLGPS